MTSTSNTHFYSLSRKHPALPANVVYLPSSTLPKYSELDEKSRSSIYPQATHNQERLSKSKSHHGVLKFTHRLVVLCDDWWLLEMLALALSAICLLATILLLGVYDNKPLPDRLPSDLTLNTYVSILSGISKYTLALPLSEALGQFKWLWYSSKAPARRLVDFENFDDAQRGPLAALGLLSQLRFRYCLASRSRVRRY